MPNLLPVAIYLRKSRSDVEAEASGEGETLSRHKRVLVQLANDFHYHVCAVYQEIVSGDQLASRPQALQMLHEVSLGNYHAVLCMDLDRLGRGNLIDQGLIQQAFKISGTLVVTPRKVYDLRDEWDEEWSEFEAFFARRELKMITRRLQRGRRYSAAEGKSISQRPPYGYLRNSDLRLQPNPQTAPVVQQIFAWAKIGSSRKEIAKKLNAMNIPAPKGGQWGASTVAFILQNQAYLGRIIWGQHRYLKNGSKYQKEAVPEEQWIKKEAAHPALITSAEFPDLFATQSQCAHHMQREKQTRHPLSSLIFCYHCHRPMQYRKSYGKRQDRLICTTPDCQTKSASYPLIKNNIYKTVAQIVTFVEMDLAKGESAQSLSTVLTTDSPPSLQQQVLQSVVERIIYRRDRMWPAERPLELDVWLKF